MLRSSDNTQRSLLDTDKSKYKSKDKFVIISFTEPTIFVPKESTIVAVEASRLSATAPIAHTWAF